MVPVPATPPAALADPSIVGKWTDRIPLANVPIHAHVLPIGKVLFWGRRSVPGALDFPSLNQHETRAFIWDPANPQGPGVPTTNQPADLQHNPINLFCSSHTFLADGRLLVTGGHLFDSQGINCSTFYDPFHDRWAAGPVMNNGRWYPTAITLPDGRAFVCGGSFATGPLQAPDNSNTVNPISQVLENGAWRNLTNFTGLPLFPRFHVAPDGSLFMPGPLATSYFFQDLSIPGNLGTWVPSGQRMVQNAEYAPSVMYDQGKIIFIGGSIPPTNVAEIIDLNMPNPAWSVAAPMKFSRRQHNATILADGTVLVTGGSQGNGFNVLDPGQPVHTAELWDPSTNNWTLMAAESVDRCYHATAVLLPDGRVLSGGGGEYAPIGNAPVPNPSRDTHADAQIFSPPYLFKGTRPIITTAPRNITFGSTFEIETPAASEIKKVTWIRLSSVTHSFNTSQRLNFLNFQASGNKLKITAPTNGNICPPGHYMLFILNGNKVPSMASIIQITSPVQQELAHATLLTTSLDLQSLAVKALAPIIKQAEVKPKDRRFPVIVGVTATCPYGISSCWGGAFEALSRLPGVSSVADKPNAKDSTAEVYLSAGGLPDLASWPAQFAHVANGTHLFRGVEVTLAGLVEIQGDENLILQADGNRPQLAVIPLKAS